MLADFITVFPGPTKEPLPAYQESPSYTTSEVKFSVQKRFPIAQKMEISISRPFSQQTMQKVDSINRIIENGHKDVLFASINYAKLPSSSDFLVRVFINKPDANAKTPTTDPHFAGTFAFFGTESDGASTHVSHNDHQHQPEFLVNLIPALQKLKGMGKINDNSEVSIQLVAVPVDEKFENPNTKLILNQVELLISPVMISVERGNENDEKNKRQQVR